MGRMDRRVEWFKVTAIKNSTPVEGCYFVEAFDEIDAIAVSQLHGYFRGNHHFTAWKVERTSGESRLIANGSMVIPE